MAQSQEQKRGDSDTAAVRAETLRYVADHPEASREEVLAHLEEAGYGNSRFPVQRWRKEATAAAAQEAAADAEPETQPEPAPKKAGSKLADMPVDELRAHLLATPQLADASWASRPEQTRPRNKGESRSAYILAMLGGDVEVGA